MRVVIFGKGFLGQKLYHSLLEKGYAVAIYSKRDVDYTNHDTLVAWLKKMPTGFIINASGYTGVPNVDAAEDNKELCWKLNAQVPATIATAIEAAGGRHWMIHISSGCIYNGYDKDYTEEDTPNFGLFNPDSSFYSKTKHAAETMLEGLPVYSLRLRIPFDGNLVHRNYFSKLMKYDSLISVDNSVTCIDDFCVFVSRFITRKMNSQYLPYGAYNVVNPGVVKAEDIVTALRDHGVMNPNHRFIELSELNTKAKRSNVVLSTERAASIGLELPHVGESLRRCVKEFAGKWRLEHGD
jgi:dTDP-4-dehydrorhamnose reductase